STISTAIWLWAVRLATAILNTAYCSCECFGNATHEVVPSSSATSAMRTAPIGPAKSMPDNEVDIEAALIATVSRSEERRVGKESRERWELDREIARK